MQIKDIVKTTLEKYHFINDELANIKDKAIAMIDICENQQEFQIKYEELLIDYCNVNWVSRSRDKPITKEMMLFYCKIYDSLCLALKIAKLKTNAEVTKILSKSYQSTCTPLPN